MCTAYSLRRSFNILDKNPLKAYLKAMGPPFSTFQGSFEAFFGHSVILLFGTENILRRKPSELNNENLIFEWNFYLK